MTIEFKPGDRVKCVAWRGAFYTPGRVYVVQHGGFLEGNDGRSFSYPLEQPFEDNRMFTLHAKAGEFAAGDKVVALHACRDTTAGKIYTAIEGTSGNYVRWIDDRGEVNGGGGKHFRLATPEEIAAQTLQPLCGPPEGGFKVGDLVEAINTTGGRSIVMTGERMVVTDTAENFGYSPGGYINSYRAQNFRLISRPDTEGWHDWSGGKDRPFGDSSTEFETILRKGERWDGSGSEIAWYHHSEAAELGEASFSDKSDIVKWRPAPAALPTSASAPPAPAVEPAPTYKAGDTVLARIRLADDINEDGEFYAGYLKAEAIVSLDPTVEPLAVGDRVRHVCGIDRPVVEVVAIIEDSAVVRSVNGLSLARLADLVLAQ